MKINPLNSSTFKGKLHVDPNCKFAKHEAIKRFGRYIEQNTSPNLDVFIKDMPEEEVKSVLTYKDTRAHKAQKSLDEANARWLKDGGNAAAIPGGYPTGVHDIVPRAENLKITYHSPRTGAMSGFFFDTVSGADDDEIFEYLVQNLETKAALDIKR